MTTQTFSDDSHAVVTRPRWEHGLHNVWFFCVGGLGSWPIDMCSNKDAGKGQHETRPFVNQQADREVHTDPELSLQPVERASRRRMRSESCLRQDETQGVE